MKVCLSTWGSRGDVEPMAALAWRLHELGAETRLCAPPDFDELADRAGAQLIPLGRPIREFLHGDRPATPADAPRMAANLIGMHFHTVATAAQDCDAVVASGLMPAGVRSIAEHLGIRYVCAMFHPGSIPSPHQTPLPRPGKHFPPGGTDSRTLWDVDAERVDALYRDPLNGHRATLGLPPVRNVRDHVFADEPWLACDPTLAPWPGSPYVTVVQTGAWILPDARPLPDDLTAFLDAGEAPVYVGMGSVRTPQGMARTAIEAVRATGRRVIVNRSLSGLAPIDDGDDCFAVEEVNQQAVFPRVAAVVHHGGAGTTTTAAKAGVPQVIVPQFADQPFWGDRVVALGIGAQAGPSPTRETLTTALQTALAPHTRAGSSEVARQIRTDGTTVAAQSLLAGR